MVKAQYEANVAAIKEAKKMSTATSERVTEELQTSKLLMARLALTVTVIPNMQKWRDIHRISVGRLTDVVHLHSQEVQQMFTERNEPSPPEADETRNKIAMTQAQLEASVGVSAEAVQRHKRLSEQV